MKNYYSLLMETVAEHQSAVRKSFAATSLLSKVILSHGETRTRFKVDADTVDDAENLAQVLEQVLAISNAPPNVRLISAAMLLSSVAYSDMEEVDFDNGRDDLAAVMAASCSIAEVAFLKRISEAVHNQETGWEDLSPEESDTEEPVENEDDEPTSDPDDDILEDDEYVESDASVEDPDEEGTETETEASNDADLEAPPEEPDEEEIAPEVAEAEVEKAFSGTKPKIHSMEADGAEISTEDLIAAATTGGIPHPK